MRINQREGNEGVMEIIQEKTGKTNEYLGGHIEIYYSRSFYTYMYIFI